MQFKYIQALVAAFAIAAPVVTGMPVEEREAEAEADPQVVCGVGCGVGGGYVFSCYDGAKTSYCKGAPYNYRCSLDGNVGYDSPDSYCGNNNNCGCDYVP